MAALFLLAVNFLTVNIDVGDEVFGFLAFRCRKFVYFLRQASHRLNSSLPAGRGARWPYSRTPNRSVALGMAALGR